ncbi:MAG: tRNA (adenosine(37)-N6)-threonylcarbamoyltransferase complex transferase subunit TsaD [Chlorobi bacterium]|nr:tRNA (adenosine(37)-N6)-threonylcarbamoyltransferase complex transferase subunit TsaD [Chlorobiota bacterium]
MCLFVNFTTDLSNRHPLSKVKKDIRILGIESSCDETAAAVIINGRVVSNIVAGQEVHRKYGGVVPELASRAHQQHIVPVVDVALKEAGLTPRDLDAVAVTAGPGLLGSLLVGLSFAKSLALALDIPLIGVHHMQAHILAHFIGPEGKHPPFPFLALTISGGHTQIVRVNDYFDMQILGETRDDAVGEAFDKIASILGLPYPGGPAIDKLAREGNPKAFRFPVAKVEGLDFSFSGLKTSVLYFLQKKLKENPDFIKENLADLAASVQDTIIRTILQKLEAAMERTGIRRIAIGGGVSANKGLRAALEEFARRHEAEIYIPEFQYTTDNAAMIAMAGYLRYLQGGKDSLSLTPKARWSIEDGGKT